MNKKVLDVTAAAAVCACFIVAAKIEETNHIQQQEEVLIQNEEDRSVTAGVCSILSRYSFVAESEKITTLEKKQMPAGVSAGNEKLQTTAKETEKEEPQRTANNQEAQTAAGAAVKNEEVQTAAEETGNEGQQEMNLEAETQRQTIAEHAACQNRWNITLTQEETQLLAQIVWLESRGEPQKGQEAVVEVIFNRIVSDKYPDTLYEVLSQKNPVQFCSWKNHDNAEPTEKEYQSIENVLNGNTNILRSDTLYFSTEPLTNGLDMVIGGHSFCY